MTVNLLKTYQICVSQQNETHLICLTEILKTNFVQLLKRNMCFYYAVNCQYTTCFNFTLFSPFVLSRDQICVFSKIRTYID